MFLSLKNTKIKVEKSISQGLIPVSLLWSMRGGRICGLHAEGSRSRPRGSLAQRPPDGSDCRASQPPPPPPELEEARRLILVAQALVSSAHLHLLTCSASFGCSGTPRLAALLFSLVLSCLAGKAAFARPFGGLPVVLSGSSASSELPPLFANVEQLWNCVACCFQHHLLFIICSECSALRCQKTELLREEHASPRPPLFIFWCHGG